MKPTTSKHSATSVPSPPLGSKPLRHSMAARRSRPLHWLAWTAALVSVALLAFWKWGTPDAGSVTLLRGIDVGLGLFFAVEFFTRSGWRQSRTAYVKWRWFDFIAIVPVTALGPVAVPAVFWLVFVCRAIRVVDRTLGDGFVQRNALLVVGAVEEEISDRVLEKMLARWEDELDHANFGAALAKALQRNKEAVLQRVYAEQLQEGTFAKIAHFTGLQASLEKEERRLFGAVIEMVASKEVDEAIRDVISSSLRRTREQLGAREWRRKFFVMPQATPAGRPVVKGQIPVAGG